MTVSEWLHYLAQNDHMIDGKYLESGHALLTARSVYDAAMALVRHEIEMMKKGVDNPTDWDKYYDALHEACIQAEENR